MSTAIVTDSRPGRDRDRGAILLLVLAVSIVLSMVVLALANFVMADLRYSQVVDSQAKRLASAESGIDYAVDRLRLNQTLCATDVAGSPISLNGATSPGTALPAPLNGTDTRITCKRLDGAIADVAGWAVVITDRPGAPRLVVDMDNLVVPVNGPVFLPNPVPAQVDTDSNSKVELVDGDLWYTGAPNCSTPKRTSDLPTGLVVGPSVARGPECTTRPWSALFSPPPVPALPTNIAGDIDGDGVVDPASDIDVDGQVDGDDLTFPGCRVFSPGRYTQRPDVSGTSNVYFKSGDYHLDFNSQWVVRDVTVWIGRSAQPIPACEDARLADIAGGATLYFDRNSRLRIDDNGDLEMFARQQGNYSVSVQALPTSSTGQTSPLITTEHFAEPIDLVVHGLIWAPDGWLDIDNEWSTSRQKLLGGVVAAQLWTRFADPRFEIRPATSAVDTRVLLTSTSTLNGVSTTVEAVVAYRPHAPDLEDRVAVNSFRVVD